MKDLEKIQQFYAILNPNNPLKLVLMEVRRMADMVTEWEYVRTSGSAMCRYNLTGPRTYEIRYQEGDLGNLVHELIHVAVNEAYEQDFINYPARRVVNPPARVYNADRYCTNEESRQIAFMDQDWISRLSDNLSELITLATYCEIAPTDKNLVIEKLRYGLMNPHKEYDTVISQILVWIVKWGYPIVLLNERKYSRKKIYKVNIFYEKLAFRVTEAYNLRSHLN